MLTRSRRVSLPEKKRGVPTRWGVPPQESSDFISINVLFNFKNQSVLIAPLISSESISIYPSRDLKSR